MLVLAFDTCLGSLSVAVAHCERGEARVLAEHEERAEAGHAERLIPVLDQTMRVAGCRFADLSRIVVTLGPGTFTGVRTGIAAARALRLATGVEVAGLTSLAAIAARITGADGPTSGLVAAPTLIAVDARRGRLYVQLFGAGPLDPTTAPVELTAEEAADLITVPGTRLAGSGAAAVADIAHGRGIVIEMAGSDLEPRATDLARLAPLLEPLGAVTPIYVRAPDAKPQTAKTLARAS
ncbi:MAG: tRNA (adenosine(37)-N6)-threonylcarbamoyltransferase complex dimerization subunit type 1 TsaB [Hyphomicrobiaceae bacterium]